MIIDCDDCVMRHLACSDCVVSVLLGAEGGRAEVDDAERRALDVLADAELVPRLRMLPTGQAVGRVRAG